MPLVPLTLSSCNESRYATRWPPGRIRVTTRAWSVKRTQPVQLVTVPPVGATLAHPADVCPCTRNVPSDASAARHSSYVFPPAETGRTKLCLALSMAVSPVAGTTVVGPEPAALNCTDRVPVFVASACEA